jgi:5-methylcytosine-specific restriction endonuclease McrA
MQEPPLRRCRKCGDEFPLTKEFFGHMPNGGFRHTCRRCVRENVSRHYYRNPWRSAERTEIRRDVAFTPAERSRLRWQLARRDGGFHCFYCKEPLDGSFHIDHKTPIASGGKHELANFALACLQCNQEKHNKDLEEYRAWLRRNSEPVRF